MKTTEQTIDEILNPNDTDWKPIIKAAGWVIYYLSLVYAGAHVFSWVKETLAGTLVLMGYIGAVGILGNAGVLPHAIEHWTMDKAHRAMAIVFYAIDILIMGGFVASHINDILGNQSANLNLFLVNVAPFQFLVPIITWGVLTIMDPENRLKYELKRERQRAEHTRIRADIAADYIKAKQYAHQKINGAGEDPDELPEKVLYQNQKNGHKEPSPKAPQRQ